MAESLQLLSTEITRMINDDFAAGSSLPGVVAVSEPFVKLEADDLETAAVRVYPVSLEGELADRQVENEVNGIAVAVAQGIVTSDETWTLIDYLQEVKNFLTNAANRQVDNGLADPNHVCAELAFPVESAPLFDQNLLRQSQIFLGSVVFPYICETIRS